LLHEDVDTGPLYEEIFQKCCAPPCSPSGKREVTLSAALEFLRRLFEVQSMRSNTACFQIVAPPELLSMTWPYLLLQPNCRELDP